MIIEEIGGEGARRRGNTEIDHRYSGFDALFRYFASTRQEEAIIRRRS